MGIVYVFDIVPGVSNGACFAWIPMFIIALRYLF